MTMKGLLIKIALAYCCKHKGGNACAIAECLKLSAVVIAPIGFTHGCGIVEPLPIGS